MGYLTYWVLPSLVTALLMIKAIRRDAEDPAKPEDYKAEEWAMFSVASIAYPVTMIYMLIYIVVPFIIKER